MANPAERGRQDEEPAAGESTPEEDELEALKKQADEVEDQRKQTKARKAAEAKAAAEEREKSLEAARKSMREDTKMKADAKQQERLKRLGLDEDGNELPDEEE